MNQKSRLAAKVASVVALTALFGLSAFAESRPPEETRGRLKGRVVERSDSARKEAAERKEARETRREGRIDRSNRQHAAQGEVRTDERRGEIRRPDHSTVRAEPGRIDRSTREQAAQREVRMQERQGEIRRPERSTVRRAEPGRIDRSTREQVAQGEVTVQAPRLEARNPERSNIRREGRHGDRIERRGRTGDRRPSHDVTADSYRDSRSGRGYSAYGTRQPYYTSGRVSRVSRHGGGYRVWVSGCNYPFFVPLSHYHRDRFRVGLLINIGGFYNRGGYYDYYDRYDRYDRYSRGHLRGVVEDVDYRRGTFVVRSDVSSSFITVVMRDRRMERIRRGDYVELRGSWRRSGVFDASRIDYVDSRYDDYYDDDYYYDEYRR